MELRYRSLSPFGAEVDTDLSQPLDEAGQQALHAALIELLERYDRGGSGSLVVPGEYLEVVIERA